LSETCIDEKYEDVANNFHVVTQDMAHLREATENLDRQMVVNDANMEWRMERTRACHQQLGTQGKENCIIMHDHMSVINKKMHKNMTVINMIAMPTMGVTTNPTTTSYSTWNRYLIASHAWMLKTKVIKIYRDVIYGITLATINMEDETRQMLKMR
jgi:hypothetical protein